LAVLPVTLNEMLRPWYAAGVLHLWPDPEAPDLDPEIAALLQSGPQFPSSTPASPSSAAPNLAGAAPASSGFAGTPHAGAAPSARTTIVPPAEDRRSTPVTARPTDSRASRPTPSATAAKKPLPVLTPARQGMLDRTSPAPVLWTYPELGVDLGGKGDPERSARLRGLIGALRLPKGTSCFWPLRLPEESPEDAPGQFLAGLGRLRPQAMILLGNESVPMCGLPVALSMPFSQVLHAGRLVLLLPGMAQLVAEPGLCAPCIEFLAAQFSGLPGIVPGGRG
jgi:hypothetical protein